MVQFISCPTHIRMTSVRIERHGPAFTRDVLDNCQHADFFFSNGYVASCYHNEDHMISECYYTAVDPTLFNTQRNRGQTVLSLSQRESITIWDVLAESKIYTQDWSTKQYIDEEIVNHILNWMSPNELIEVEDEYYE